MRSCDSVHVSRLLTRRGLSTAMRLQSSSRRAIRTAHGRWRCRPGQMRKFSTLRPIAGRP